MTRNRGMGSAERHLCDSRSENGKEGEKCCYFDVILVGVSLSLKLGVS